MNRSFHPTLAAVVAALAGVTTATSQGGPANYLESGYQPSIVLSNEAGHPTNNVPTLNVPFAPGTSTLTFVRPWFSSDGAHWVIEADADTGSTTDDLVLLYDGTLLLQEGTQAPWGAAGENIGLSFDDMMGINTAGQVLITHNTTAAANDDYVVLYTPGMGWTILAQEGGMIDPTVPALAGLTWDDALETPNLTNAGVAGFEADGIDGGAITTADDNVLVLGSAVVAQSSVTVPAGQAGGATNAWQFFDASDYHVSPDGANILIQGDTDNATTDEDDILVFNGTVVLQENHPIPGGPFTEPIDVLGLETTWMDDGGNWYAAGNNDTTEQDWIVRNGVVVAFTDGGNPIVPGSTETWDDTTFSAGFFSLDGNSAGAFAFGGLTDNADTLRNGVIVYDDGMGNRKVVVREGDPVDLNGNGLFDDDRFFNTFGDDDLRVLADGSVWTTASLKDGTGSTVSYGWFRFDPTTASCTFRNGSGINPADYACESLPVLGGTWNSRITTNADTVGTFIVIAFAQDAGFPFPLFNGEILVDLSFGHVVISSLTGVHSVPIPNLPILDAKFLPTQALRLDSPGGVLGFQLLNAIDLTLGQ